MGYGRDCFDTWDVELKWCQDEFKGDGAVATIRKLYSYVYHIWKERNRRVFSSQSLSVDGVSHIIVTDVRLRCIASKLSEPDKPHTRRQLDAWGIDYVYKDKKVVACSWLFPSENEVMVNIDGAIKDAYAGSGAIISDHMGTPLAAACGGVVPTTVVAHECRELS
ncbi:uncharacterized protein LOC113317049 [Papaver somniferum]|uniref:uncharacterized protein LOC113317049 n=1 Tax=Papaver somniferum TaxID=3469 RepID=UPI000E70258A|nr:uncharacterized protein LOC113317049 [Papaver somniferum]